MITRIRMQKSKNTICDFNFSQKGVYEQFLVKLKNYVSITSKYFDFRF